jgi:hypothetical protein
MLFVSMDELHVTVKIPNITQKCFYGEFVLPERLKGTEIFMYSARFFLSDCNIIWNFSTDVHISPLYQISRKSVQ